MEPLSVKQCISKIVQTIAQIHSDTLRGQVKQEKPITDTSITLIWKGHQEAGWGEVPSDLARQDGTKARVHQFCPPMPTLRRITK